MVRPMLARLQRLQNCAVLTRSQDSVGQAVCGCLRSDGFSNSPPASATSSQASLAESLGLQWSQATEGWERRISLGQWFVSATNHWMSRGSCPEQFRLSHLRQRWSFTWTPLSQAGEVIWTPSVCRVTRHTTRNSFASTGWS